MTFDARHELFGERSELLVQEAVWHCRDRDEEWPTEVELLEDLIEFSEVQSPEDARNRLEQALRNGETEAVLDDERGWLLCISQDVYDQITRRYMDRTMPRADERERF